MAPSACSMSKVCRVTPGGSSSAALLGLDAPGPTAMRLAPCFVRLAAGKGQFTQKPPQKALLRFMMPANDPKKVTLRVVIADDEPLARDRLRTLLQGEPGTIVAAECENGFQAMEAVEREKPDLVFLDVRMPELDGFQVLEALRPGTRPGVIFTTAHGEFALKAFEQHAIDFLLKPFDRDRLRKALTQARRVLSSKALEQTENALPSAGAVRLPERLAVKSRAGIVLLQSAEIEWMRGADNYTEIHSGKSVHLLRQTLGSLEQQLQPMKLFLRISRSHVVNTRFIQAIQRKSHGDFTVVLRSGTTLPGSRNFRAKMLELLEPAR